MNLFSVWLMPGYFSSSYLKIADLQAHNALHRCEFVVLLFSNICSFTFGTLKFKVHFGVKAQYFHIQKVHFEFLTFVTEYFYIAVLLLSK